RPTDPRVLINLGAARYATGDMRGALAAYRAALSYNMSLPAAQLGAGMAAEAMGFADAAFDYFFEAAALDPDSATAQYRLGLAYGRQGFHREAAAALRSASELAPTAAEPLRALVDVLWGQKQLAQALVALEKLEKLTPQDAQIQYRMAQLEAQLAGRAVGKARTVAVDRAMRHLRKALLLDPRMSPRVALDPAFHGLKTLPAFQEIVKDAAL
ncbi:MAG: tetratricopeptide repeat protein, partial [Armatimonadetes bacterium]|nr:tetratricopeptide repeat protein [Armatimonadota bacterium]